MKRIILHWTAGGYRASALDRAHYHLLIEGDGTTVLGDKKPEANENTSDGDYAAHVRGFNTGSIGVGLCAMAGAEGWPKMAPGRYPITKEQLAHMAVAVADLCETYNIPVTRETVLTHAEVEITHGVKQRGKWDIRWLPGMTAVGDPIEVGDQLRRMISEAMKPAETVAPAPPAPAVSPDSTPIIAALFLALARAFGAKL